MGGEDGTQLLDFDLFVVLIPPQSTCPGRHVGHSALFIMISHILVCFDVGKPVDDAGNEFEPVAEFDEKAIVRNRYCSPFV